MLMENSPWAKKVEKHLKCSRTGRWMRLRTGLLALHRISVKALKGEWIEKIAIIVRFLTKTYSGSVRTRIRRHSKGSCVFFYLQQQYL